MRPCPLERRFCSTSSGIEAPRGYDTIYGNNQGKLAKPITTLTLDEVIAAGPGWTRAYKSSAAGRYQFMNATLKGLKTELGLSGGRSFDVDLQDRLGHHLLRRRGYDVFVAGQITATEFGRRLAQEWASLPVLAATKGGSRNVVRGQSYYAGDRLNKSLIPPKRLEAMLELVRAQPAAAPMPSKIEPAPVTPPSATDTPRAGTSPAAILIIFIIVTAALGTAFLFLR